MDYGTVTFGTSSTTTMTGEAPNIYFEETHNYNHTLNVNSGATVKLTSEDQSLFMGTAATDKTANLNIASTGSLTVTTNDTASTSGVAPNDTNYAPVVFYGPGTNNATINGEMIVNSTSGTGIQVEGPATSVTNFTVDGGATTITTQSDEGNGQDETAGFNDYSSGKTNLVVKNSGTMDIKSASYRGMRMGTSATGHKNITVTGAGSKLNVTGQEWAVTSLILNESLELNIQNGGKATFTSGSTNEGSTMYVVGGFNINVDGSGSQLDINETGQAYYGNTRSDLGQTDWSAIYHVENAPGANVDLLKINVSNTGIMNVTKKGTVAGTAGAFNYGAIHSDGAGYVLVQSGGKLSAIVDYPNMAGNGIYGSGAAISFNTPTGYSPSYVKATGEGSVINAKTNVASGLNSAAIYLRNYAGAEGTNTAYVEVSAGASLFATNYDANYATVDINGTLYFNKPGAFDIKNLNPSQVGEAVRNITGNDAVNLTNTSITTWLQSVQPGYSVANYYGYWSDLTDVWQDNIVDTTAKTGSGLSGTVTTIDLRTTGRLENGAIQVHKFASTQFNTSTTSSTWTADIAAAKILANTTSPNDFDGTYYPGGTITYYVTVENITDATLNAIPIKDTLSAITTTLGNAATGSTTGAAFSNWTITSKVIGGSITSGTARNDTAVNTTDLNDSLTLAANTKILYTIVANVAPTAYGSIYNTATGDTMTTQEVIRYVTVDPSITTTKTANIQQYTKGGSVTYTVTVANAASAGYANDMSITDALSSVTAKDTSGNTISAFTGWTITKTQGTNSNADNTTVLASNTNVNVKADIGSGETAVYTIVAAINPLAIGDIKNCVNTSLTMDRTNETLNDTSLPLINQKEITSHDLATTTSQGCNIIGRVVATKAVTGESGTTAGVGELGETLTYTLTLNNTAGTVDITNQTLQDNLLMNLPTGVTLAAAPTSTGATITSTGTSGVYTIDKIPAASTITITYAIKITDDLTQYLALYTGLSTKSLINVATVDSSTPGTSCTTGLACTETPLQGIPKITSSKLDSSGNSTGTYVQSTCTSTTCTPGTLTYKITVANEAGSGFGDNIPISDSISGILSTLSNGSSGPAFTSWTITAQLTDASGVTTTLASGAVASDLSSAGTFSNNTDLNTTVDIAPGSKIVYTITATINPLDVASIVNIATVNGTELTTTHTPAAGAMGMTKLDVNGTSTGTYEASGNINYIITISNTGTGLLNDVSIADAISSIIADNNTGSTSQAISTWTITAKNYVGSQTLTSGSTTSYGTTAGTFANSSNINTAVDIAPGDKVIYYVTAQVRDGVIGGIVNTATATDGAGNSATGTTTHTMVYVDTINDITITKTANVATYKAGDAVTYTLTLSNTNTSKYALVNLQDLIDSITVTNLSGTTGSAYNTSGMTITSSNAYDSNINDLVTSSGKSVLIAPSSSVTYTIANLIANQVYGDIVNTATATLNSATKTATNTITPNINNNSGTTTGQKKVISVQ